MRAKAQNHAVQLALEQVMANDRLQAEQTLLAALKLDPDCVEAMSHLLGALYCELDRYDEGLCRCCCRPAARWPPTTPRFSATWARC